MDPRDRASAADLIECVLIVYQLRKSAEIVADPRDLFINNVPPDRLGLNVLIVQLFPFDRF